MLNNSSILVTGGTGSFGHKFVELTIQKYKPKRLIIFSRDEMKQWEMAKLYEGNERVRFFIGDVRDKNRLHRTLHNIDFVIHAAATKIVPTAEYNPFECIKTNPGEKLHEQMISKEDSYTTYEFDQYYKIIPHLNNWENDSLRISKGKKVPENFIYSSDNNKIWMKKNELKIWIDINKNKMSKL